MIISYVVAYDQNQGIGINNDLPWHLADDLKFFKRTTLHKPVVMGRKTYESIYQAIGKPLPKRRNVILSRTSQHIDQCEVYTSIPEVLEALQHYPEVCVIGGAAIFEKFLPLADKLYITEVQATVQADVFFPKWDKSRFELIDSEHYQASEGNQYPFDIQTWLRKGLSSAIT